MPGKTRIEEPAYGLMHWRVRKDRGLARDFPCVDCFSIAQQWTYNHDTPEEFRRVSPNGQPFSIRIEDYDPRCVSCHKRYDDRTRMPREKKKVEPNPPKNPDAPAPTYGRTYPREVYTKDEMDSLLKATSGSSATQIRNYALIYLLWRSGLRISEALALRSIDIDRRLRAIHVRHGKGNKERRVRGVDPHALEAVDRWLTIRDERGIPRTVEIFCTLDGEGKLFGTYVRAMLTRLAKAAGWEKRIHPHGMRHTFAADLARRGATMHTIQEQLGHTNLSTTSIYLSGISGEEVAREMDAINWDD